MPRAKKRTPPKNGSEFVGVYKGKEYRIRVIHEDGQVFYLVGQHRFTSPSYAGRHVTGHHVNGWVFWNME